MPSPDHLRAPVPPWEIIERNGAFPSLLNWMTPLIFIELEQVDIGIDGFID